MDYIAPVAAVLLAGVTVALVLAIGKNTGDAHDGSFSTGEITQTLMAGSEAAMRAEQTYLDLLSQARQYDVEGDTLTLLGEGGAELLIFRATE